MGEDTQAWPPPENAAIYPTGGLFSEPRPGIDAEKNIADDRGSYVHLRKEAVNHPPHYNAGKIEVIEFIEDQRLNFSRGNVIKYVARAGKKEGVSELQDLEKAAWYLAREIELLKATHEQREPRRPNDINPRT